MEKRDSQSWKTASLAFKPGAILGEGAILSCGYAAGRVAPVTSLLHFGARTSRYPQ